jgi:hypothetical protein
MPQGPEFFCPRARTNAARRSKRVQRLQIYLINDGCAAANQERFEVSKGCFPTRSRSQGGVLVGTVVRLNLEKSIYGVNGVGFRRRPVLAVLAS